MEILSANLWSRLEVISEESTFCRAAVAYISCADYIKFRKGDLLIVNASNHAIGSGATSALVLEKLLHDGIDLYSNDTLHAKILLFNEFIYLGSANISNNSRNNLIETGVIFDYKNNPLVFEEVQSILISIQKDERTKKLTKENIDELKNITIERREIVKPNKFKKEIEYKKYWALGIFNKNYDGDEQTLKNGKEKILEKDEDANFFFFKGKHSKTMFNNCYENDRVLLFSRNASRDVIDTIYLVSILHTFIDKDNIRICFYRILGQISVEENQDKLNDQLASLYKVKWVGRRIKNEEIRII